MSYWKDTLCFLTVLVIWGVVGHFEYEDAVAEEKTARNPTLPPCMKPGGAVPTDIPRKPSKRPCAATDHREASR
jgi:hypothetical protein